MFSFVQHFEKDRDGWRDLLCNRSWVSAALSGWATGWHSPDAVTLIVTPAFLWCFCTRCLSARDADRFLCSSAAWNCKRKKYVAQCKWLVWFHEGKQTTLPRNGKNICTVFLPDDLLLSERITLKVKIKSRRNNISQDRQPLKPAAALFPLKTYEEKQTASQENTAFFKFVRVITEI